MQTVKNIGLLQIKNIFLKIVFVSELRGAKVRVMLVRTEHNKKYLEIMCQLDATEVFIAYLIACSTCFGHHYAHHQELKSIIQWLLPVVFHAVVFKLLVWCGAEGYVSSLQDAATFRHKSSESARHNFTM